MKIHQAPVQRKDAFILSYLELRRIVGFTSFALPITLAVGKILTSTPGVESSLSNYYYTDMRNIFVGTMCVIGLFLAACHGYDRRDSIAGKFAGICAIGIALFPTTPDGAEQDRGYVVRAWHLPVGYIHLCFAVLLFLSVAYFCLRLFTLTSTAGMTPRKRIRNRIYVACGWTTLVCIAMVLGVKFLEGQPFLVGYHPVFWIESVALVAFGVAWLTKGEWILRDGASEHHTPVTYIDSKPLPRVSRTA